MTKTGDKKYKVEAEFLERLHNHLLEFKPARTLACSEDETEYLKSLFLLTSKPVIYTANIGEKDMGVEENSLPLVKKVIDYAKTEKSEYMVICAKTEEELSMLEEEEQKMFLEELGVKESGLDRLVKTSYRLLGLLSYLTAGEKEVRAWTIENGTKAPQAAGKIHTDFEKGFIRAEIVDYDILVELGSFNAAKEKGKVRSEGKEYVMRDSDVVLFRFNV
jgi:GTP-binding protein YchF